MRLSPLSLVLLATAATTLGSTLTGPSVEVRFGGSGHPDPVFGHVLGGSSGQNYISDSRTSDARADVPFRLSAAAGFGVLKASSEQSGLLPSGTGRTRNATAFFWDRLLLTVPGASQTTYAWQPTVRLSGMIDWTLSGTLDTDPAGVEVAQSVRTEGQTGFTHHPHLIDLSAKGAYNDLYALPAITVPANEWFNYRLLLAAFSRVQNRDGLQITSAEADFFSTLEVVGLSIKDSSGNLVPFEIQSASGALYSSEGITAVPEPASVALVSIAGAVLLLARRKNA